MNHTAILREQVSGLSPQGQAIRTMCWSLERLQARRTAPEVQKALQAAIDRYNEESA